MPHNPYENVVLSDLILRDRLAASRTVLANERTMLAYVRTALSLLIAGAAVVKFSQTWPVQLIGWALMPVGAAVLLIGLVRYRRTKAHIEQIGALDADGGG